MTILTCPVANMAATHPTHLAVDGQETLTYDELNQRIAQWGYRLSRYPAGGIVAIRLMKPLDTMAVMMACFRWGLVAYPVSGRLTFHEQFIQISRSGAVALVTDGMIPPHLSIPVIEPSSLTQHRLSDTDYWLDQAAVLLATSGTTALSRLAMLGYGNLYYSALGMVAHASISVGHRMLLCLPLFHVGGIGVMMRAFLAGATVVIHDKSTPLSEQLQEEITHVSLVPTQIRRLSPNLTLPRMESILVGGARLDPIELQRREGWPIQLSYGCTEMGSTIAILTPSGLYPLPYRSIRVTESGEIQVRGETLFWGYWEDGLLRLPLTPDGWFVTNDYYHLHHDGWGVFRDADWINSGGEKILIDDLEQWFKPVCEACLVTAIPDDEYGQRPVMMVRGPIQPEFDGVMGGLNAIMRPLVLPWNHQIDGVDKQARAALREWAIQFKKAGGS